jgi:hypothetical protein
LHPTLLYVVVKKRNCLTFTYQCLQTQHSLKRKLSIDYFIRENWRGGGGLLYNGLNLLMGLLFSLTLLHPVHFHYPSQIRNYQWVPTLGRPYVLNLASNQACHIPLEAHFLVAIRWYLAHLIWKKLIKIFLVKILGL